MRNKRYSIRWHEWDGTGYPDRKKCTHCKVKNTRTNNDGEPRCIDHFDIDLGVIGTQVLKMTRPDGVAPTTEEELLKYKNQ